MKKITISKKFILGIIVGSAITAGLTVTALTLNAKEITYSPSNPNFKVNNSDDALNFLYKLTDYEIPKDTYFYDKTTKGKDIKRYKKVNNKYYECNQYGNVLNNTEVSISVSNLIEYKGSSPTNLSAGFAGYANKNFILGDGSDIETSKYDKRLVLTAGTWKGIAVQSGETYHDSTTTSFENYNNEWVDLYIRVSYSSTNYLLSSRNSYVDVVGVKGGKDVYIGKASATGSDINKSKVFKFSIKEYDKIKLNAHAYVRAVSDIGDVDSTWSSISVDANYEFH